MAKSKQQTTTPHLGYFLDHSFWENALDLLEYQLSLKSSNRHFNTLSMFYYERLNKKEKKGLRTKTYFNSHIANNLFYGLEKEFAIHSYPVPKSNLGLRKYRFITYPMRITYYSVGLYLLALSQELIYQYYKHQAQIHSNYGGQLKFDESTGKLILTYDAVWYKTHYQRFRHRVREELKGNVKNKIVIHLDVQNYFEEIPIPSLLTFLSDNIKPSVQKELRFDPITQSQITGFFEFIANGGKGIPQTDNDIISSFIGNLYLVFGDLLLDTEIKAFKTVLKSYSIIRYMDDIYLSLEFNDSVTMAQREISISHLASRVADCLYEKLGLRLNVKTKLFWLNKEIDRITLIKNLKRVSPGFQISDEVDGKKVDPKYQLELIFKQLELLKQSSLDPTFDARGELDDEILKEAYNKSVSQLMHKKENKQRINHIFQNFNFDLAIARPREIMIILLVDEQATADFKDFLLKKQELTSRDIFLILTFLCQTGFNSSELMEILGNHQSMSKIMEIFMSKSIGSTKPGYYNLIDSQVLRISDSPNVIEQIRLRVHCEHRNDYSVALNHLLNEVHSICLKFDKRQISEKDYSAIEANEFLQTNNVPHQTRLKIRNLFDRRNKNPVSHADPIAWPVDQGEYFDYHNHVGICLGHVLNSNQKP